MAEYKNGFYRTPGAMKPVFTCDKEPDEYKGFLIYERVKDICFDIVKDGVCVGMNSSLNGAKERIDGNQQALNIRLEECKKIFNI